LEIKMRVAAVIANVLMLMLVGYIFVEEGFPSKPIGQVIVLVMLFSAVTSLAALSLGDSSRISDLKRQVKEAELEKQLEDLRKS
jgi:hypothetical protein